MGDDSKRSQPSSAKSIGEAAVKKIGEVDDAKNLDKIKSKLKSQLIEYGIEAGADVGNEDEILNGGAMKLTLKGKKKQRPSDSRSVNMSKSSSRKDRFKLLQTDMYDEGNRTGRTAELGQSLQEILE